VQRLPCGNSGHQGSIAQSRILRHFSICLYLLRQSGSASLARPTILKIKKIIFAPEHRVIIIGNCAADEVARLGTTSALPRERGGCGHSYGHVQTPMQRFFNLAAHKQHLAKYHEDAPLRMPKRSRDSAPFTEQSAPSLLGPLQVTGQPVLKQTNYRYRYRYDVQVLFCHYRALGARRLRYFGLFFLKDVLDLSKVPQSALSASKVSLAIRFHRTHIQLGFPL